MFIPSRIVAAVDRQAATLRSAEPEKRPESRTPRTADLLSSMTTMTPRRMRGFTAVEVLMSLAVLGILAALAAPSFRDFANEQRLSGAVGGIAADLQFARTEAIKRNARVLMCAR